VFKAEIIETKDQKIILKALDGKLEGQEITSEINQYDVISMPKYEQGEKVFVEKTISEDGSENFYVLDHIRHKALYLLAAIFAALVLLVGKTKGARALVVLIFTFFVILKFIIPKIMDGSNPLFISIIGSLIILGFAIYTTEGLNKKSNIAIFSVVLSLAFTGIISIWFSSFAKLSGFESEEAMYLADIAGNVINIKGLLLAGIIIGALGVLDDVVISQVVLVDELKKAGGKFSSKEIYSKAMKVGISHLSSMVNTLFLAYAGVSIPLLILFTANQGTSVTIEQMLNNEMIATEIVRALAGSVGIILAVPISTFLAALILSGQNKSNQS